MTHLGLMPGLRNSQDWVVDIHRHLSWQSSSCLAPGWDGGDGKVSFVQPPHQVPSPVLRAAVCH